jgi:hypothetical protein
MTKPSDSRLQLALPFALLATNACATVTVEQHMAVAKVLVITTEPARDCQNLGPVTGSRDSDTPSGARARTLAMGGNTVRVDAQGGMAAFYCPNPPEVEPTP